MNDIRGYSDNALGFDFLPDNPEWKQEIEIWVNDWSPKEVKIISLGLPIRPITDHQKSTGGFRKSRDSIDQWHRGAEIRSKLENRSVI